MSTPFLLAEVSLYVLFEHTLNRIILAHNNRHKDLDSLGGTRDLGNAAGKAEDAQRLDFTICYHHYCHHGHAQSFQ